MAIDLDCGLSEEILVDGVEAGQAGVGVDVVEECRDLARLNDEACAQQQQEHVLAPRQPHRQVRADRMPGRGQALKDRGLREGDLDNMAGVKLPLT